MDRKLPADSKIPTGNICSYYDKDSDGSKRKKSKSRSSTIPPNPGNYQQNLDEWLESCLKDAAAPQLSSSSEFLDYNASSFSLSKNNSASNLKKVFSPYFYTDQQKSVQGLPLFASNSISSNLMNRNPKHMMLHHTPVDFASLPPVNFDSTAPDNKSEDNLDVNEGNRRFSDPCLAAPSDNGSKQGEKTNNETQNAESAINNTKFLTKLWEQINLLHETNSKICRNLQETKVEIEALKHTPSMRHRRDSLSGISTHSQPLGFAFGTHSPAPTYHSGMYTPGIMTEVIREVKDAARIREEALLSRVKALVEERSWTIGEGNIRMMRDIEDMKAQIQHLRSDRKDANKRISQLETENKYLKSLLASILSNRTADTLREHELPPRSTPIRKNSAEHQRSKRNSNLSINYGILQHDEGPNTMTVNEKNFIQKSMSTDSVKMDHLTQDRRSSYSISDSSNTTPQNGSFRLEKMYTTPENERSSTEEDQQVLQMEKGSLELRRELQEAIANKKQAENRIIALENMVKRLQIKMSQPKESKKLFNGSPASVPSGPVASSTTVVAAATGLTSTNIIQSSVSPLGDFNLPQQRALTTLHNFSQSQQIQTVTPKLSLAGPVTDL